MKRNRLLGVSLAVMALAASACSDSGTKTLSEDDFIGQMEDICRTAKRDIQDVDTSDPSSVSDIVDIIQTGLDDLNKLKPPKALANDFGDFVDNLDDQLNEAQDLADAIDAGDQDAAQKAADNLTELSADGDQIAEDLGADRCVGVGGGDTPTDSTEATDTTDVADTTESTDATDDTVTVPATDDTTPNTPLPIDSTPVTQPPTDMTQPPPNPDATGEALDASQVWTAPDGYEWGALTDLAGVITPSTDPVLGPVLIDYSAGIVQSTSGGPSAIFYITEISTSPWEQDQIDAYFAFSFGSGGSDTSTPLGLPAKIKPNAADGLDGALAWLNGAGIAVIAPSGTDVLTLIDEFYNANVMGG